MNKVRRGGAIIQRVNAHLRRDMVPDYAARRHLIACGLIGEPVPPVMTSGGPQKKNS
jgi:hypothetical protein